MASSDEGKHFFALKLDREYQGLWGKIMLVPESNFSKIIDTPFSEVKG